MSTHNQNFSAGLWIFAQSVEKYGSYTRSLSVREQIQAAAQVPGLKGLELIAPTHVSLENVKEVKGWLDDAGLKTVAVNPLVWTDPLWHRGALTSPDPKVRRAAIDIAKRAVDIGQALGSTKMDLWPGEDGFDYQFQADYGKLWQWTAEGVREIAEYDPKTRVGIEYKPNEPRMYQLVSNAAKAALLGAELGLPNVGGYLDFGHALLARENPAEAAALLARHKRLIGVHVNDNYGLVDDDLMAGSLHIWTRLEFLMTLEQVGYNEWISVDIVPRKENAVGACKRSIESLQILQRMMDRIDRPALEQAQAEMDAVEVRRIMQQVLG
jgi:xylose isomerase